MSNEILNSQIWLLQSQIDNLEKSGFFTEKEMDSKTYVLRQEIEALQLHPFPMETVLGVSQDELPYLVQTLVDCVSKKYKRISSSEKRQDKSLAIRMNHYGKISPALQNTWNTLGMQRMSLGVISINDCDYVGNEEDLHPLTYTERKEVKATWNRAGRNLAISKG